MAQSGETEVDTNILNTPSILIYLLVLALVGPKKLLGIDNKVLHIWEQGFLICPIRDQQPRRTAQWHEAVKPKWIQIF